MTFTLHQSEEGYFLQAANGCRIPVDGNTAIVLFLDGVAIDPMLDMPEHLRLARNDKARAGL